MSVKYILFDLDGTLSDSAEGITKSAAYALEKFGIVEDPSTLGFFVGPPLIDMFKEKYSMSDSEANLALKHFRVRFEEKGIYENCPYDGIEEMLGKLSTAGKKLIVATSKPEKFARIILERYGFTKYFTFIGGASMNERERMRKDEVIEYVLEKCGIKDANDCIMVGDRYHDVEGAAKFGIKTVGVLYGYGNAPELLGAGAIHLCESPQVLCEYLIS